MSLVEPDRVRREVYTDPAIFDLEMRRIHETVWIYCGHGAYSHRLVKVKNQFTIRVQRVDMANAQAAYDYVLQVWV